MVSKREQARLASAVTHVAAREGEAASLAAEALATAAATAVHAAILEIQAALEAQVLAHEGLRDYASLNLTPGTKEQVIAEIAVYDSRKAALEHALAGLVALEADGYPELPVREIPADELADLQANADTIAAALLLFKAETAFQLNLDSTITETK